MIAIVDYGVGNLFSLQSSLHFLGIEGEITRDAQRLRQADRILLPGVGAFGDAAAKLRQTGLVPVIEEETGNGKPMLGICLGMQLLFDKSFEYGEHRGLGLIPGEVRPFTEVLGTESGLKIPQIGWNRLIRKKDSPLLKYQDSETYVYYVHSYYAADCEEHVAAVSEYGIEVPGLVSRGSVYGMQFHPEKSGRAGLAMLQAFSEL